MLEIGAGVGNLTQLLLKRAKKVIAVEIDPLLCRILKETLKEERGVELIQKNILEFPLKDICRFKKLKVVGNLPYYISKPILMYLLENRAFISLIVLLVQSEVAERLIAPPRSRSYGALSVFTQFYSEVEIEFKLSKTLFYPPPKVNSSVVRIIPKKKLSLEEELEEVFTRVVKASFQKRRKMLKNSLKSLGISERALKSIFQKTNINPQVRAEELSESDFVKLTRAVYQFLS